MPAINLYTDDFSFVGGFKNRLKQLFGRPSFGPNFVEANLLAGLNDLGAIVRLNSRKVDADSRLCVLRGTKAFNWLIANNKSNVVIGPNFTAAETAAIFKRNSDRIRSVLVPSKQVESAFIFFGVPKEKIVIWPVGINTQKYADTSGGNKTTDALIYFKRRRADELLEAEDLLKSFGQTFRLIEYGKYRPKDLLSAAAVCRYAVILDGSESQGIAVEEIMSLNLPLFVFDQIYIDVEAAPELKNQLTVSSVPYWSDLCGVKVPTDTQDRSKNKRIKIPESKPYFEKFLAELKNFRPREFVVNNLSLEKQAREFINLF